MLKSRTVGRNAGVLPLHSQTVSQRDLFSQIVPPNVTTENKPNEILLKDIVGPGFWFAIHKLAIEAQTPEQEQFFLEFLEKVRQIFPCERCVKHMEEYLKENPISYNFLCHKNGIRIGYFYFSWNLHNHVNQSIGKPLMSFEEALSLYYKPKPSCGSCAVMRTE